MIQSWKKWCRLCAREDYENEDIHTPSSLSEIINKHFSIDISPHDDWPQNICNKCSQLILKLENFSQRVSKVQMMFAELFRNWQLDAEELKVQYSLNESYDTEYKTVDISKEKPCEVKENISLVIAEQMIDLEELSSIKSELRSPITIKTENSEEDYKEIQLSPVISSNQESNSSEESREDTFQPSPKAKTFMCSECKKIYARYANYRNHIRMQHGKTLEPARFHCPKCDKIFSKASRLREHAHSHLSLNQKLKKPCPYCDKKFSQTIRLQVHIRSTHFDRPNEHKLSLINGNPFKCSSCHKRYKSKYTLKLHEDTHNNNYICMICGLQLKTSRTLRFHMAVHSDQKLFECDCCGKKFRRLDALKNHFVLHTKLKPYSCNFCDTTFAYESNCRRHTKRLHPAELAAMEATETKIETTNIPNLKTTTSGDK